MCVLGFIISISCSLIWFSNRVSGGFSGAPLLHSILFGRLFLHTNKWIREQASGGHKAPGSSVSQSMMKVWSSALQPGRKHGVTPLIPLEEEETTRKTEGIWVLHDRRRSSGPARDNVLLLERLEALDMSTLSYGSTKLWRSRTRCKWDVKRYQMNVDSSTDDLILGEFDDEISVREDLKLQCYRAIWKIQICYLSSWIRDSHST